MGMITKNIGKNTIGDGKKMTVELKKYRRSTHDLSYAWRNTQCAGTIVPFACELGLPGDTHDINLEASVLTHPTVGPLFGSFKFQMELYVCPIRLYNGLLHNNALGIGLNMAQVKLPKIEVTLKRLFDSPSKQTGENNQINKSSLFSYLGLKGYGNPMADTVAVKKNATSFIAYWDIFKNYHANKQEENAYYIGVNINIIQYQNVTNDTTIDLSKVRYMYTPIKENDQIQVDFINDGTDVPDANDFKFKIQKQGKIITLGADQLTDNGASVTKTALSLNIGAEYQNGVYLLEITYEKIELKKFPLENIDQMREYVLSTKKGEEFVINSGEIPPYGDLISRNGQRFNSSFPLAGLAVKTYQSDIFNNWVNTEWLDGEGGINEITAIDTSSGSFTMDTLNLAKKVYDMLNRIAVSGGTYGDWLETVYTNDYIERSETPVYMGGGSQEIVFQEVISNSATEEEPLGSLAGRGRLGGEMKGGNIVIKVDEPSYIIGLCSITPRIDYAQGNRFDTSLDTIDDLHKPALDGIGFQDLTTEKMAWWTEIIRENYKSEIKTVGKQPAWIDYMTNYNRIFGNFADSDNEMFMTLCRNYETKDHINIKDLTTYIDPQKYNYIFADTSRSAQNFWVQIGVKWTARRKMSAKIMPNL
nr:MAG TPA: Major capsid protein [Bacteriophage sp.]